MPVDDLVREPSAAGDLGAGLLMAGEALAAIQRLQLLDDLWTSYLADADPEDRAALERDLPALQRLVSEMSTGLRDLPGHLRVVRGLGDDFGQGVVEETLVAMLSSDPQGRELIGAFRDQLGDVDFRGAVIAACDFLDASGQQTERELEDKLLLPPTLQAARALRGIPAGRERQSGDRGCTRRLSHLRRRVHDACGSRPVWA